MSVKVEIVIGVQYSAIGGMSHFFCNTEEYEKHKANPIQLVADHLGVSIDDCLAWVEDQGYVQCVAMNKNGEQCKASISGRFYDCSEWALTHKNGGYCRIHGGE